MKLKIFISALILTLTISCAMNIILYEYLIRSYRQQKECKIDPTNSLHYSGHWKQRNTKHAGITRIVFFGDSRIYQWKPLPDVSGCEIINRGVPGETTSQSILRIDRDVISMKPDIAVIEVGVNDCNAIGILPEVSEYILSNCKNNIKKMIDILNRNNIKTVILTIFPIAAVPPYRWPVWSEKTRDAVEEINAYLIRLNSSGIYIINCDTIFSEHGKMKHELSEDMLHINSSGYTKLNTLLKPHLVNLVKECNTGN